MRRVLSAAKAFLRKGAPAVLAAALGITALTPGLAAAQAASPPVRSSIDENGVDLTSGSFRYSVQEVSIGQPGSGGLSYQRDWIGDGWRDNLTGNVRRMSELVDDGFGDLERVPTNVFVVSFGAVSETFELVGGVFVQAEGSQSTLTFDSGSQTYTYNNSGVVMVFDKALNSLTYINGVAANVYENEGRIVSITYPTGEAITFHYKTGTTHSSTATNRLQSVTNNLGYQLKFTYVRDAAPTNGAEDRDWWRVASVTGINGAVDYCDPTADSCTYSVTWPNETYSVPTYTSNLEATDTLGRTTRYYQATGSGGSQVITAIRRPTSPSADSIAITYDGANRVSTVSDGVGTWSYSYTDSAGVFTTTKTDPLSKVWIYKSESDTGLLLSEKDPLNRETTYAYDDKGRVIRVTRPEGDADEYSYDARGNVTEVRRKAKPGSSLSDIVTIASYPSTCTNVVTCNKPTSTTDAMGEVTDYTYDGTHGGVLTVTAPAPTSGAARPQTRYSYTALYAWYKNSSGTVVQAPSSVYRVTASSACATGSSCAGGANELVSTVTYGATGVANNLLATSQSSGSGDATLTVTSTVSYNDVGDVVAVDGPLSGSTDTMLYRYDAGRQRIGIITPDPDGSATLLKPRANRYSYNDDGQPTLIEQGTVDSPSDTDWAAFVALTKTTYSYDARGRTIKVMLQSGSTTYAVTQYSYDVAGRPDCAAQRMNSFSSLPTSACTASTAGANGPDRIGRYVYDPAGRIIKLISGYGTANQRDEFKISFTADGLQATVSDALGSLTSYEYDGLNRLSRIHYPNPSIGSRMSSSSTDYESYNYDAASRLVQQVRRDGAIFGLSYDALGRITAVDAPSAMEDLSYTYDNFGRRLTASQYSQTLISTFDILGRKLTETGPLGTVAYQYDLASRRTRMTWPDSFYVTYSYDDAGYPKAIQENGSASSTARIGLYGYTTLGTVKSISRANGVGTSFGSDAVGRPTTMVQNAPGTTDDQTYTLTWNPASQIKSRAGSNASFAVTGLSAVDRGYESNGLNQLTLTGTLTPTYDARGNMTSDGVNSYSYDAANRMTGMPGLVDMSYDPYGRLYEVAGTSTTKFLYDGVDLIAEYDAAGTTLLRRYVHGPGFDEPLIWYEGAGTTDRRWLITDQIGSVVSVTNGSGAVSNINKYDEYGVPGLANVGRFQYTGQTWISEIGLYYYKSRMYSPNIGKFVQPDAAGYADGTNIYNYVASDPVNSTDPSGFGSVKICTPYIVTIPSHDEGEVDTIELRYSCQIATVPALNGTIYVTSDGDLIGLSGFDVRQILQCVVLTSGDLLGEFSKTEQDAGLIMAGTGAVLTATVAGSEFGVPMTIAGTEVFVHGTGVNGLSSILLMIGGEPGEVVIGRFVSNLRPVAAAGPAGRAFIDWIVSKASSQTVASSRANREKCK